jgi:UDP-3-O-[3-hydroxymyristoyl] glucosamine N-acyltransferase
MEFTAKQIAELLHGEVDGNPNAIVSTIAKIEEGQAKSLSFLANPKYTEYIYTTKSAIVIVNNDFMPDKPVPTLIRVSDAYTAFARLLELFQEMEDGKNGVAELAYVSDDAKLGKDVYVGEFAYIGPKVEIGDQVKIYPQVFLGENCIVGHGTILFAGTKVYPGTIIGANCIIHAGAVIGSDGFGFAPQSDNQYKKVPQTGHVEIEDHVEIGANTTIDRATLGKTIIRKGVKLDNLVQIAHNVEIGENTVIAAQTGISGSTRVGRNCMFGGQVGLAGHLQIADGVKLNAQSGVPSSIKHEDQAFMGTPIMPMKDFMRSFIHFKQLDKLSKRLQELEQKVNSLHKQLNTKA